MRKLRTNSIALALIVIAIFAFVGCATLVKDSYRSLASTKITYEAIMAAAHDAWIAGYITDEDVIPLIEYGNAFWVAYQTAASALETYAANEHNDTQAENYLNAAIRAATSAFAEVLTHWNMIQPIIDHAKNKGVV